MRPRKDRFNPFDQDFKEIPLVEGNTQIISKDWYLEKVINPSRRDCFKILIRRRDRDGRKKI